MKRVFRSMVIAMTALAAMAAPATATATGKAAQGEGDLAGLQQKLDDVVAAGAVGTLAEVRDGRRVWRGTSGIAERGTTRPVPVNGRVRVGSITKTFVATVVLQLVDEGELRLDDSVEEWLPGVVPNGDRITVRQLLNHTSGLFDYIRTLSLPPNPEFLDNRWRTWAAQEQIQRALANPPTFDVPGSAYAYSNTNYLLLGRIVEEVTGRSYGLEIKQRVIRPLRLRGTTLPGTSPWIRGPHPHGYVPIRQDGGIQPVDFTAMNPSLFGAGGEMISTTRDLNTFFAALLGGRLLPDHLLAEMKTPAVEGREYGLGLSWRTTSCGITVYGNEGDALAYESWSFSTPDGRHQATLSLSHALRGGVDPAVTAFLDKAICDGATDGGPR